MENNRKITFMFWLLLTLVLLDCIEKTYQAFEWFHHRFGDTGTSLRYSK
jgi:hypothetical protein